MRVATIDIGTNSVLLTVAERRPDGTLAALEERATITRLGEGVDRTRTLSPEAIARTVACLDAYAASVRRWGVEKTAVVGTSAMRDAAGGEVIAQRVRERFAVELRIISGDEEARLAFAGAMSGLDYGRASGGIVVFDIGGGSTRSSSARSTNTAGRPFATRRASTSEAFASPSATFRAILRSHPSSPRSRMTRCARSGPYLGSPRLWTR